jgi:hypothetical protein
MTSSSSYKISRGISSATTSSGCGSGSVTAISSFSFSFIPLFLTEIPFIDTFPWSINFCRKERVYSSY